MKIILAVCLREIFKHLHSTILHIYIHLNQWTISGPRLWCRVRASRPSRLARSLPLQSFSRTTWSCCGRRWMSRGRAKERSCRAPRSRWRGREGLWPQLLLPGCMHRCLIFPLGFSLTFFPGLQPFAGEVGLRSDQGVWEVQQGPSSVFGGVWESYGSQQKSPQDWCAQWGWRRDRGELLILISLVTCVN